jgi:hypothetical protein
LTEEIPRQHSIQAVAWILLSSFSQVYSENWEQKAEQKKIEKLAVWLEKKHV